MRGVAVGVSALFCSEQLQLKLGWKAQSGEGTTVDRREEQGNALLAPGTLPLSAPKTSQEVDARKQFVWSGGWVSLRSMITFDD